MRLLLICVLVARGAIAQSPDTSRRASGAVVSGVVTDSISGLPLTGAVVQLVAATGSGRTGRNALSDSLGFFSFRDIPDGGYTIGFFHPLLDSLGVDAQMGEVNIAGHQRVSVDLWTPSITQLRAAVCGSLDSGGVLVGIVRNAGDGAPIAAVTVKGEWQELSFTKKGLVNHAARLVATTGENGWFALCNVPTAGTMSLLAARGSDSTDLVEIQIPANGFIRRELYIGLSANGISADAALRGDALPSPRARVSAARISGTVVEVHGGKPIFAAEVRIPGGFFTRTNEKGEWTLPDVPLGTRMLEVRALGYSPQRGPVDVAAGAAPIRTALLTLKATLETVRVSGNARVHYTDLSRYEQRRRSGIGKYVTATDIERDGIVFVADIFGSMPGLQVGYAYDTLPPGKARPDSVTAVNHLILMRSISGEWCAPGIYLNGVLFPGTSADDLNTWITAKEVAGIEVYSPASVPAEFDRTMSGCGSIVIWRK